MNYDSLNTQVDRCLNPTKWTAQEFEEAKEHLNFLWNNQKPWVDKNRLHFDSCLKQINTLHKRRLDTDAKTRQSRGRGG